MADGSEAPLDVYGATVLWDGRPRRVRAFASDGGPLVGMALLRGHELRVEVTDGGAVEVRRLLP